MSEKTILKTNESPDMKIGVVCYPTYGGSGVVATELGMAMANRGHQVHFITYGRPARLPRFHQNTFFHEVRNLDYALFEHSPYETSMASKLVDVVTNEKLDILHVHYAIPHAAVAFMAKSILASKGVTIPVITTLHGTDITLVGKNQSFVPVVEFSINNSDGVTAVSKSLRDDTLSTFDIKKDINVIYNFIDFERFKRSDKDHFRQAIAPEGEKILMHISNFRKVKRVQDVIRIFQKVQETLPSKLILIGDGPEREALELLCRDLQLCSEIRFLGKQSAIEELLAIADVFLMPSAKESFGLAALEAMACEVPVVSSNAGGLPEVVIDEYNGYTWDIGDVDNMAKSTIKILSDEALHSELRQNAFQTAQKFDIHNIVPKYEDYYRKIIEITNR